MTSRHLVLLACFVSLIGFVFACRPKNAFGQDSNSVALIVGINRYIDNDTNRLYGCVDDAVAMRSALENLGFECVPPLLDQNATRSAIVDALKRIRDARKYRPLTRFVFYYSGHGTSAPFNMDERYYSLFLNDSREKDGALVNGLTGIDLYNLIASINATSRTVILDSCFSAGIQPGLQLSNTLPRNLRYRPISGARYQQGGLIGTADDYTRGALQKSDICYITACTRWESSQELTYMDSSVCQAHGVFTRYLAKSLGHAKNYEALMRDIRPSVDSDTDGKQHPTISNRFRNAAIFDNPSSDDPLGNGEVDDVIDVWYAVNDDAEQLTMESSAPESVLARNQSVNLSICCRNDPDQSDLPGKYYLVVLSEGESGSVKLLYPTNGDGKITVDSNWSCLQLGPYTAGERGLTHVRSFLFADKNSAKRLCASVGTIEKFLTNKLNADGVPKIKSSRFFTADMYFYVQ